MEFIGKPLLVSANPAAVEAVSPWSDRPAGRKIRIAVRFDSDVYERIVKEAEEQDRTIAATVNRAFRSAWKIPATPTATSTPCSRPAPSARRAAHE